MFRRTTALTAALAVAAPLAAAQVGGKMVEPFEVAFSANEVLGERVRGSGGESLGSVHDMLLIEGREPLYAVLSVGGVLGIGDKLVAVPFNALDRSAEDAILLDADQSQLEARAAFDYADISVAALAPLGFGAAEPDQAQEDRSAYLDSWSTRLEEWQQMVTARIDDAGQEMSREADAAWQELKREWDTLGQASSETWDEATQSFEAAFDAFEQRWNGMEGTGEAGGQEAGMSNGQSGGMSDGQDGSMAGGQDGGSAGGQDGEMSGGGNADGSDGENGSSG